jgi:hypothetical protein
MAQSNDSQTITNWWKSVKGVQLSIAMTTNVFLVGSSAVVTFVTKNSSANAITVFVPASIIDFDIILTNDTGTYHIIPQPNKSNALLSGSAPIEPGAEVVESIPVMFREEIKPGDYTLKAIRKFTSNNEHFTCESNPVKVQIIK